MTTLVTMMVLAYLATSTSLAAMVRRARSLPPDASTDSQRLKRFKAAVILATGFKYALMIGVVVLCFLDYQTLRYWIGAIGAIMGLEELWAGFSMLQSANTFSLRSTSSPEKVLKALEREAAALKHRRGLQLLSSVLFVAIIMFFFFQTKAHRYLSLWDLGGVIFFYATFQLWFILRMRYLHIVGGKLQNFPAAM
jgi:hypothetical protein